MLIKFGNFDAKYTQKKERVALCAALLKVPNDKTYSKKATPQYFNLF
jgi:hypothetical protein